MSKLKDLYTAVPTTQPPKPKFIKHPDSRYHKVQNGVHCWMKNPTWGVVCTRVQGHSGEHEAHDSFGKVCTRNNTICRWT